MQVVKKCSTLAQELGAEDHLIGAQPRPQVADKAHRDRRFDHDGGARAHRLYGAHHSLNAGGVKVVVLRVVIGRSGDDHKIGPGKGRGTVRGRTQTQRAIGEEVFQIGIDNRALARIDHSNPLFGNISGHDIIILRQKDGVGEPYVTKASDCDFHDQVLA